MKIFNDFSLKQFNTFGLNVNCDAFVEVEFAEEIYSVNKMFELNSAKHLIVGQGSNILFTKDFDGIVIHPVFNNCRIKNQNKKSVLIEVEAGKNWNEFVQFTVSNNIWGIENLISIPGLAGAAPIQNIGAYGQEVKNVIEYVQFFDFADGLFKIYENSLCKFDYRNSIFKNELNGKGLIISIEFRLSKTPKPILDYGNVKDEILKSGIINPSIVQIATTISNIRSKKLPDTDKFGNAGSFFKNPIISRSKADEIKKIFPDLPLFKTINDSVKIPAAYLIEKIGYKGKTKGNVATYFNQPLVLINLGNATGAEILDFANEIIELVKHNFDVLLETEVNII